MKENTEGVLVSIISSQTQVGPRYHSKLRDLYYANTTYIFQIVFQSMTSGLSPGRMISCSPQDLN